jgi:cytochrome P450
MIAFPEIQRRAQAEIDSVVGRDHLPTFADAPRLPYVRAIIKEIFRWRSPVPFGVPHAATKEDWYEAMYIPKGAICKPNAWHCAKFFPDIFISSMFGSCVLEFPWL